MSNKILNPDAQRDRGSDQRRRRIKNGFTLLEVIVAVFIIAVGVGGVAKIMPSLISGSSINQSRLVSAYLAQEGIEIVRNIRDTNWLEEHNRDESAPSIAWDEGFTTCNSGCEADYNSVKELKPSLAVFGSGRYLNIDSNGLYGYGGGTQTKFKREITITKNSEILTITVNISWDDRGKHYDFPVQEKLHQWY